MLGGSSDRQTLPFMTPAFHAARGPILCLCLCLFALGACSTRSQPEKPALTRPDADLVAAVQAIRAANAGDDSALQVNPLRDPAVEGFLAQAQAAEKQQQLDAAYAAISKARALAPDAPDLLQYEAEIEFLRGKTVEAEKLAYDSFKKGPQVGTLCVQNWQTIVEARKIFNDVDYRAVAEAKRDQCKVKRPVRL
jgi:predicted Zn-dependent protease